MHEVTCDVNKLLCLSCDMGKISVYDNLKT